MKLISQLIFYIIKTVLLLIVVGDIYAIDLEQAYRKSLNYNADYLQAIAQNIAGHEFENQGLASLLPQLNAGGNYNYAQFQSGGMQVGFTQPSFNASATQVLYDFNKFSTYKKAIYTTDLSDLQITDARQQLMLKVGQAYFELLYAKDTLLVAKMTKNALKKQLDDAEVEYKIGKVTIADINDAKSGYDTAVADEIQAQNDVINKQVIFQNITGVNPELIQPIISNIELVYPNPDDVESIAKIAQTNNLSIKIAKKNIEISYQDIKIAKSGHLPVINLMFNYQFQGTANINYTDSAATAQLVQQIASIPGFPLSSYNGLGAFIGINIPLYSGGMVSSQVRQQLHLYEVARDQLLATKRDVDQKVRFAYLQVHNGVGFVKAQSQALTSAKIKLDSDKTGYKLGIRNSIDLVNSQKNYYKTWQDYNQSRYQYLIYRLQLEYLLGNIDEQFIKIINVNIKQ